MARPKKIRTPEEQAKHDKFWARYKTHNGPRGNADEWKQAARGEMPTIAADLTLLGLTEMPTLAQLSKARRRAMITAHPDAGGAHAMAVKINAAYEKLKKQIV